MAKVAEYVPTEREQAFLDTVEDPRHDRQIINGLNPFFEDRAPEEMKSFYAPDEITQLMAVRGTERDVEDRMPVKITRHYFDLAKHSKPLQKLVKASPDETLNLAGSEDPGYQMDFSPVEGLLHKYEMGLMYVVSTCSAHCRFCYREELIARKEVERQDGTVAKKGLAQINEVTAYVRAHNELVEANGGIHPDTGRSKLREILLSGGDPMMLPNSKIAAWLAALAEAGIESIRLGTKDMAFFPQRFDDAFFSMLDRFHETYPDTGFRLMIHFNHPDEFLLKGEDGEYLENPNGSPKWHPDTKKAIEAATARGWMNVENQAPIIKDINDDADALRIMQRALYRVGVGNHYFFCGRDIVAYRAFNVPIETAWQILNESQRGLSGVETHARLSITHYKGKTEVAAVTNEPIPGLAGAENGVLIFKILRNALDAPDRGKVCIVGRNPEAIWFDDYEDRVLFDEAGLYEYSRVKKELVEVEMPQLEEPAKSQRRRPRAPRARTAAEERTAQTMIDKSIATVEAAVTDVFDGATVMVGGFGEAGSPIELLHALIDQGASGLTVVNNNTGSGEVGLAALIKAGRVAKMICSYPRTTNSTVFPELYKGGRIELELVPQGTLAERIRAGGAGIPAFYTPTSVGTPLEEGKERRTFDGRDYVLERGLTADFAIIKCRQADTYGNLLYNMTARNFSPVMAMAAKTTIVQAGEVVAPGQLDPESVVTPGIFVDRVVAVPNPQYESELVAKGVSYP